MEKKVPKPLKQVLSSGETGTGKGAGSAAPVVNLNAMVDIVSPKVNEVFGVGDEVAFRASVKLPQGGVAQDAHDKAKEKYDLVWTLFKDDAKQGLQVGRGNSAKKKLDAGSYRVELNLIVGNRKAVKNVLFRVVHRVVGRVMDATGAGQAGVDLVLTDLEGSKKISQAKTDNKGDFFIETPPSGSYSLRPKMAGCSFYPYNRIVKFVQPPALQEFRAIKGEIIDVKLTGDAQSDENIEFVCPLQQAYLKFLVKSEAKPTGIESSLITIEKDQEKPIPLDDVSDQVATKREFGPEGTLIKVQVPAVMASGPSETTYRLRVTVVDAEKNSFSAEAPVAMKYNVMRCFKTTLDEAVSLQGKGQFEQAIKTYRVMEKFREKVDNPAPFAKFMEKSTFNRGLAAIQMLLLKPPDERHELVLLNHALTDFAAASAANKADTNAVLFTGLANHLLENYKLAVSSYNKVLNSDPKMAAARELRALANLKIVERQIRAARHAIEKLEPTAKEVGGLAGKLVATSDALKKNTVMPEFMEAVDDFTEAIQANPEEQNLRKSRKAILKMAYDLNKSEANVVDVREYLRKNVGKKLQAKEMGIPLLAMETSTIPVRDMALGIDSAKFVRK